MSVFAQRIDPGQCMALYLSKERPAHWSPVLYAFVREEPDTIESRICCWRHRPTWALDVRKPTA